MSTDRPSTSRRPLHIDDEECRRIAGVMEIVGRRWSSGILLAVGTGAARFSEIERRVHKLSGRMLSVRLRELEAAGLVDRVVEPTTPVSITYHLSERGTDLLRSLQPMAHYARRWERPVEHDAGDAGPETPLSGGDVSVTARPLGRDAPR